MPFYLRKSVSVGPFRFNLSSQGVGVSAGIKGLRIGAGPRGNYIQMGRGGLYYRASLGAQQKKVRQESHSEQVAPPLAVSSSLTEIEVGDILQMVPAKAEDILSQINDRMAAWSFWPYPIMLGLIGAYYIHTSDYDPIYLYIVASLAAVLTCIAMYADMVRKTVVLMYDLGSDVENAFSKLSEAFEEVGDCQKMWNVDAAGSTSDWKRNAGASRLLARTNARFSFGVPAVIKTNVSVPCIMGGKQNIYFFPDIILITDKGRVGAVTYKELEVGWGSTIFIETEGVPRDSEVVGQTWRYVNKKGGPDKRFNNNRQIPEVRYQIMTLSSVKGLQKMLHLSKVVDRYAFDDALRSVTQLVTSLSNVAVSSRRSVKIKPI
jgi:hypothetical protein